MKYLFPLILLIGCGAGESVLSEVPDASDEPDAIEKADISTSDVVDAAVIKDSPSDVANEKDSNTCQSQYTTCLESCDHDPFCGDPDHCFQRCEEALDDCQHHH